MTQTNKLVTNPKCTFIHYLKQLLQMLERIKTQQQGREDILQARLHADMLPFIQQVRTAANFALRACCPLAGLAVVSFENKQSTWQGLTLHIQQTIDYLQQIDDDAFQYNDSVLLTEQAGFSTVSLAPGEFLMLYTLPNFFFHLSMVYAIARQQGIAISKGDFDGFHGYPAGFSFESDLQAK